MPDAPLDPSELSERVTKALAAAVAARHAIDAILARLNVAKGDV